MTREFVIMPEFEKPVSYTHLRAHEADFANFVTLLKTEEKAAVSGCAILILL